MLTGLLANPLYVRVRKNQFRVRSLESSKEATFDAQPPFTTARLLIGQFVAAESVLKRAVKEMSKGGIFAVSPQVLIHPIEMIDGGLYEVAELAFRELAIAV